MQTQMRTAFLVLEDGTTFPGRAVAADGISSGEICFTTGMAGYEESVAYHSRHANSELVTLDAGHFAMLVRSKEANAALRRFVMRTTGARDALAGRQLKADRSP